MHNERMPEIEKDKSKINDAALLYREMIGSLQYVVACTRPDMANVVHCLGKYNGAFTRENYTVAKRAIRYLIGTKHFGLVYRPTIAPPLLSAFSDADHAMCKDTSRSTTGSVLQLNGYTWMWKFKQQGRVATNTCASELVAASDCVDNMVWAREHLNELKINQGVSTIYCDIQSTIQVIVNHGNIKKVQRFAKEVRMIAEFMDDGALIMNYVSTTEKWRISSLKHLDHSALSISGKRSAWRTCFQRGRHVRRWEARQTRLSSSSAIYCGSAGGLGAGRLHDGLGGISPRWLRECYGDNELR